MLGFKGRFTAPIALTLMLTLTLPGCGISKLFNKSESNKPEEKKLEAPPPAEPEDLDTVVKKYDEHLAEAEKRRKQAISLLKDRVVAIQKEVKEINDTVTQWMQYEPAGANKADLEAKKKASLENGTKRITALKEEVVKLNGLAAKLGVKADPEPPAPDAAKEQAPPPEIK